MNVRKIALWVSLALLVWVIGFVTWVLQNYRPTLEYAYVDIQQTQRYLIAVLGLTVLGVIAWRMFKR